MNTTRITTTLTLTPDEHADLIYALEDVRNLWYAEILDLRKQRQPAVASDLIARRGTMREILERLTD